MHDGSRVEHRFIEAPRGTGRQSTVGSGLNVRCLSCSEGGGLFVLVWGLQSSELPWTPHYARTAIAGQTVLDVRPACLSLHRKSDGCQTWTVHAPFSGLHRETISVHSIIHPYMTQSGNDSCRMPYLVPYWWIQWSEELTSACLRVGRRLP